MLQFGLRAHDFGRLPAEELADALAAYRPASIQLALSKALPAEEAANGSLSPGYARRLRRIFESRGIAIAVLGCYINPVHPDPVVRERELRRFEEHLSYVRDFGCAIVGTETGYRSSDGSFHPDTEKPETFDLLCRSLERLLRAAESASAILGVEAVADKHTISSIEKMATLLHRLDSPNLQVIYDPVNLIPQHWS
jgi:L-ribulose-5-phosphate 3-epimerase